MKLSMRLEEERSAIDQPEQSTDDRPYWVIWRDRGYKVDEMVICCRCWPDHQVKEGVVDRHTRIEVRRVGHEFDRECHWCGPDPFAETVYAGGQA